MINTSSFKLLYQQWEIYPTFFNLLRNIESQNHSAKFNPTIIAYLVPYLIEDMTIKFFAIGWIYFIE